MGGKPVPLDAIIRATHKFYRSETKTLGTFVVQRWESSTIAVGSLSTG
ncbi:hypothetical protein AB4090_14585 [Acidithiobacillus sp. IBUN Pt1247-S3]